MAFSKVSLVLTLLLTVILFSAPAYANMEACPSHRTQTKLHSKRAKTIFETATINDINTSLGNAGQEMGTVLAFVDYSAEESLSVEVKYLFSVLDAGAGKYCVKLDKADAYFYARPRIVMPKDFKKGSCEYNFILKHEQRHLDALYDFHKSNTHKYSLYLGQIAGALPPPKPVEEQHVNVVQSQIEEYFSQKFGALVMQSIEELQMKQQKIDSPEEYAANHRRFAQCAKKRNPKEPTQKTFDDPLKGFDPRSLPFGRRE